MSPTPTLAATVAVFAVAVLAAGCGPRLHTVRVEPDHPDATVYFDEEVVGQGAVAISVPRHDARSRTLEVCGPAGWRCTRTTLDARTPERLPVAVPRDDAWHETVGAEDKVNVWMDLPANRREQVEEAWTQLRELAVAAAPELEVDDPRAYFLRSQWRMAGSTSDADRIRSRLLVGLSESTTREAIVFKVRIESERVDRAGLPLSASTRTFAEYATFVEDARASIAALNLAGASQSATSGSTTP